MKRDTLPRRCRWRSWTIRYFAIAIAWSGLGSLSAHASPTSQPLEAVLMAPLELELLEPDAIRHDVVTANTISQSGLTIPSLWFVQEQIANQFSNRLVENWLAYPGSETHPRRIDLVVNQQVWSLLNYLDRYTLINRFGSVARDYEYSVRVFNRQQRFLGAYLCSYGSDIAQKTDETVATHNEAEQSREKDLSQASSTTPSCRVVLDSTGPGGLRGRSTPFAAFQPINSTGP